MRRSLGRFVEVLFGEGGAAGADPEDLFEITTARTTLEVEGYEALSRAGLCFSDVESVRFDAAVEEVAALLDVSAEETTADYRIEADDHGYRWVLLSDALFEDLVGDVHMVADALIDAGFETALLCAAFAFDDQGEVYWLYNFKRGSWYPFAPAGDARRDEALESDLRDLVGSELDVESDADRRYPLWGIPF